MSEAIRWTIKVSKQIDLELRSFLGARGMKKGDLSKFVEDAVRWRMLDATVRAVKQHNRAVAAGALQSEIDEAVRAVRKQGRKPVR